MSNLLIASWKISKSKWKFEDILQDVWNLSFVDLKWNAKSGREKMHQPTLNQSSKESANFFKSIDLIQNQIQVPNLKSQYKFAPTHLSSKTVKFKTT